MDWIVTVDYVDEIEATNNTNRTIGSSDHHDHHDNLPLYNSYSGTVAQTALHQMGCRQN